MERRRKILIAVAVLAVLVILGVLLYLWLMGQKPSAPVTVGETPSAPQAGLGVTTGLPPQPTPNLPIDGQLVPATPAPATPPVGAALERLASAFAERYGSYANNGDFANLLDLKPVMTSDFAASTDAYVEASRVQVPGTVFVGITSRAVVAETLVIDEGAGKATVSVDLLREERLGDGTRPQPYYQRLILSFVKEGDAWKVSRATWEQQKRPR